MSTTSNTNEMFYRINKQSIALYASALCNVALYVGIS